VLLITLLGTDADVGLGACEFDPSVRPGAEKLSGSLEDLEQRLPMFEVDHSTGS
jgi:hypothetical protein